MLARPRRPAQCSARPQPRPRRPAHVSPDPAAPPNAAAARAAVREAATGNPGQLVSDSVEACLEIAATWHAWDGRPVARTVDGKPNTWTPAKALRRITDHLIDHLQQVEALLAGVPSIPDAWHGRFVTLDADWARFTEADYDEACSRLRRLGRWYVLRYAAAGPRPGMSRAAGSGHCGRSPSTSPRCGTTPSRSAPWPGWTPR